MKSVGEKCYVYVWYDDDKNIVYVGKGSGDRAFRHPFLEVELVLENLTNEQACEYERKLIAEIGRKDLGLGPLINRTNGGDGGDTISGRKMYHNPKDLKRHGSFFLPGEQPNGWVIGRHPSKAELNPMKDPIISDKNHRKQRGQKRPKTSESAKKTWQDPIIREKRKPRLCCIKCHREITKQNFERHYEKCKANTQQ